MKPPKSNGSHSRYNGDHYRKPQLFKMLSTSDFSVPSHNYNRSITLLLLLKLREHGISRDKKDFQSQRIRKVFYEIVSSRHNKEVT